VVTFAKQNNNQCFENTLVSLLTLTMTANYSIADAPGALADAVSNIV